MLCIERVSHTVSHQQLLMEKVTILHNNHHLLLALLASSAGIELISLSVRVTSAKFQQSVGGTETGTHTPHRTFRSSVSTSALENFYFYSRKTWIFYFSFYSRKSRSEFQISLSTLEIRDRNFTFLFLLSKFEIRISYFSFYSRNSRPEFQISLSTLEIRDQNFKFLFLLSNLLFWLSSMPGTYICRGWAISVEGTMRFSWHFFWGICSLHQLSLGIQLDAKI